MRACNIVVLAALLALAVAHDLSATDVETGRRRALGACASCHGPDGNSRLPTVPSLTEQEIDILARYFAGLPPTPDGGRDRRTRP